MKHLKMYNEGSGLSTVLFELDGVDKISYYDSNKSLDEIKRLLNSNDIYLQMAEDFKSSIKDEDISDISNESLGYELSLIKNKNYISRIRNVRFGEDGSKYGNIKY